MNIIKYVIFLLIILNILIPVLFINIFSTVGWAMHNFYSPKQSFGVKENSISSHFEISLYIAETGKIKNIPFEEYISQVVYAEMPASFEMEALKAQAIAVRSYTYKKLQTKLHENADVCNNINHCQAWRELDNSENYKKVVQAVEETEGMVALYNGDIINAVYHASSGGFTEDAINVWTSREDYLVAVESPKEDIKMSEVTISKKDFLSKLQLKGSRNVEIKILSRTEGNRVKEISINKKIFAGNEIRKIFDLRSSNFEVFCENGDIKFQVKGYGHGVGLSQWGAQAMALEGKNCEEIIKHYYTGVEIKII